jgi:hypothetical protein
VRCINGEEYEVVARRENTVLGEFIVVRRQLPGGWKAAAVTYDVWLRRGFVLLDR